MNVPNITVDPACKNARVQVALLGDLVVVDGVVTELDLGRVTYRIMPDGTVRAAIGEDAVITVGNLPASPTAEPLPAPAVVTSKTPTSDAG